MSALLTFLVGVALVDSLNPTTIVPALYLAAQQHPYRNLVGFAVGFFAVNMTGGLILDVVLGRAAKGALPHLGAAWTHRLEVAGGVVALAAGIWLWRHRDRIRRRAQRIKPPPPRVALLTGLTIGAVEFPTAVPYFAVVAAVAESTSTFVDDVLLLALFNAIFLAPVAVVGVLRAIVGDSRTEALRAKVLHHAGTALAVIVLGIGVALLAIGAAGVL